MKIKIQLWALSYASIDSDDELYTATIGLYESSDDAFKAMKDNVSSDIKDGDIEDKWKINDNGQAEINHDPKSWYGVEE